MQVFSAPLLTLDEVAVTEGNSGTSTAALTLRLSQPFAQAVSGELRMLSSSTNYGAAQIQQFVNVAIVVAGVYLIHEQMLTMGGLIAATMLSGRAMAPLGQIVGLLFPLIVQAIGILSSIASDAGTGPASILVRSASSSHRASRPLVSPTGSSS